jgi:hypothetical protein
LIIPGFPHGSVELLPDDREASNYDAIKWLAGERPLPARRGDVKRGIVAEPVNVGTQLVAAIRQRDELDRERIRVTAMAAGREDLKRVVADLEADGATVRARIADLYDQLGIAADSEGEGSSDG